MDEQIICAVVILVITGIWYCSILRAIDNDRKTLTAKIDAVMAKLIDAKFR